jgi:hypothetical protein
VIFPTNEGNAYVQKVAEAVQSEIERPVDYAYYKKENQSLNFMHDINFSQTMGDVELLFCSTYLSVGVDINDLNKFDIVYTEDFTAHEIEQFNNRLRKVDIASYYFVSKSYGTGAARTSLITSTMPNLRIANMRTLELNDLLSLHSLAKVGNDSNALFDFFKKHMNKPYIIKKANDEVELHPTCYSLYTFEDIWRKWSVQVPVLCQLLRDFGYTISAIDSSLLDSDKSEKILNNARHGFRLYNDVVKDDLQFLLKLLENPDFFDLLMYSNKIVLLNGNVQKLHSNEHRIFVTVSNVPQCFRFIRGLRMLSKYYTCGMKAVKPNATQV